MRIIAIGSGKGGVGRSTITANLGVALANMGKSTLIVDGNLTTPNQGLIFNLEKASRTLNDALTGDIPLQEAIYKGPSDVEIAPASVTLQKIKNAEPSNLPRALREQIEGYDFVLIDTPNGLRKETVSALKSGEELIIVTVPELTSVSDSMKTKVASEFLGLEPIGLILNQVKDEEYELDEEEIRTVMNLPILSTIPHDKEVRHSLNKGKLLLEWKPNAPAAKKIRELGEKLIEENSGGAS